MSVGTLCSLVGSDVKKLKQMLESNKSMIEQHDANKRTALHFAAHSNNVEELKLLLNNGADANATDWVCNCSV